MIEFKDGSEQQAFGVAVIALKDGVLWLDKRRVPMDRISAFKTV